MAITCSESVEVWGGIVEAFPKVFGSLESNRLFGMVEDETKSSIDEEVAPFSLEIVWESGKNFGSCFIINFCGVEEAMWHGDIGSAGAKGVDYRVVWVNDPPWDLITIIRASGD